MKEVFIVFSNEPYYPYLVIETSDFKEAKRYLKNIRDLLSLKMKLCIYVK